MAQPAYESSPSSSYKFNRSILEYASQTPAKSSKMNPLHSGPHSMNRRENNSTKRRMSRLEMMKIDYQQKLLKEKEDKLSKYHVANRDREPRKTNSGGTVREFFAERRALEAQQDSSSLPPIQAHFERVKGQKNQAIPALKQRGISQQESLSESTTNSTYSIQRRQSNQQTVPSHQQSEIMTTGKSGATRRFDSHRNIYQGHKRTKGIDKQDPLPPLHKGSRKNSDKPPTPNKRYETYADLTKQDEESDKTHTYVPTPPREARPVTKRPRAPLRPVSVDVSEDDENISVCTDDAPPNLRRLKAKARLQKQLSLQKMNTNRQQGKAELSNFQKWQREQDQAREERLDQFKNKTQVKHPSYTEHEDGDKSSDLAKREQELLQKIKDEQARLARLQNERQRLEEQEKQEAKAEEEWALKLSEAAITTRNEEESAPEPVVATRKQTVKNKQKKSEIHTDKRMKEEMPAAIEQPDESYKNFYAEAAAQAEQAQDEHATPCSVCGRSFASDRLARHEKVCAKNSKTKRKTFNSTMQRALGTEYEKYVTTGKYKEEPEKKAKKVDWRVQHENFIKTIRYAKGVSEEPPPPTENPEYVQCPYCKRKFNPYTAERHIPKCKDIKARPAPLKKR